MAIEKKRGTSGQAKNFITRTQAVRKLQISLPDFRRLCIFKGIFPREPRNRKKANKSSTPDTTFYYTKDIKYLLHEPLLAKFREHKIISRKIAKALGRGELKDAQRFERNLAPRLTLNHIIKERYPTFVDALRDLDDALSTLSLFASLPSNAAVPSKTIGLCQRLCHEFQHFVIVSRSLRKSFLSIKGIYYQANVHGQDIMWIAPYSFVQSMSQDVDFRIMATFVEFYTTLLSFVNYRLFNSLGLVYPPKFDQEMDKEGAGLSSYRIEGQEVASVVENGAKRDYGDTGESATNPAQVIADNLATVPDTELDEVGLTSESYPELENSTGGKDDEQDSFQTTDPTADILLQPVNNAKIAAGLFAKFTFYLSRETPRGPLEFLLRAFGCTRIGWDPASGSGAFTSDETDSRITHQVVDRPPIRATNTYPERNATSQAHFPHTLAPGRMYVQPQWIWDCVNAGVLLPSDSYSPGATLPPHLSPFIKPRAGVYNPLEPLSGEEENYMIEQGGFSKVVRDETTVRGLESVKAIADLAQSDEDPEIELNKSATKDSEDSSLNEHSDQASSELDWEGISEEDEAANISKLHQRELEAEAFNQHVENNQSLLYPSDTKQRHEQRHRTKVNEQIERRKLMLSRRKRKLFEKMQHSNMKRDEETEKLRTKRRRIFRETSGAA